MYVNLIPKEWKLSDSEYPEKWFFTLASDDVIVGCEKADHSHGMYPAAVASPEADGYSITPVSRIEIMYGLQGVLDFMFNSHVTNVRKAINDMLIVDPFLVNIKDLEDPSPGKLIRLRRPAWGRGVDKVVQQLQVNDITRANISDSAYITQWMDRISGADQSMQGALRQQFFQDIGTMFAVHTQQYMTQDSYIRVVGRQEEQLKKMFGKERVKVSPYELAVNYDLIVRDGSIPGTNIEAMTQMWQVIATTPELHQEFDTFRMFMYIAKQLGAKNLDDFRRNVNRIQPTTMSDEEVANQVEKGNLVPTGEI